MARLRSLPEAPACNFLPFPQMFANFCRGWHHCRCRPCPPPPCNYLKKKNLRKWLSVGNLLRVERPFCTVLEIEATMQHQCPWSMFFTTHQKPTYTFIIEPLFLSKLQSAQFCWKTRSTKWWWFFVLQRQVCISKHNTDCKAEGR